MTIDELNKQTEYNATEYVNDSAPDIDAEHLNKNEQKLKETVQQANNIIDTLKALISDVQTESSSTVPSSSLVYQMQQQIDSISQGGVSGDYIKKSDISNVQVDDQNKVPSSALAYSMQQQINEANSNLGEHFSEAERQIGTWMGKPLYRQCFHPTVNIAAGTQSYNISLGLSGVEVAMIDYAHTWCMGSSNTDVYCIPYVHNDAVNNVGAFLIVGNTDVKFAIRKGTNTSIRSIWITLTYTKTTDS